MMSLSWPNKLGLNGRPQAVFIDRDGVINRDSPDYVTSWDRFIFLPGARAAIAALTAATIDVIVVTNQSALARGMMAPETLADIHRRLIRDVTHSGGRIRGIFHCPHHPDDRCDCRKPEPGLILQAQARFGLDLKQTVMIGDRATDIACGHRAGCGATILVQSGRHHDHRRLRELGVQPNLVAADLAAAVRALGEPRSTA